MMVEGESWIIADGRKREIASSFPTEIAESMVDMPERTAMILIAGMDGEGRLFYVLTPPFWDFTMFNEQEQREENREAVIDSCMQFEERIRTGTEVMETHASYDNIVGFIRHPKEMIGSFPEGKMTEENYGKIVAKMAIALMDEPDKWITDG